MELIASENFASRGITEALGSCLTNKYSEGYPKARYYGGNQWIDEMEMMTQRRCLEAYNLDPEKWGVNVQPHSACPANFQVYNAVLKPHDRIMGLDLPHGGHLSHGFRTAKKRVSATSKYFESIPYRLNEETGLIDYEALQTSARIVRPNLIIAGTTAYSRCIDYKRMAEIASEHDAYLMADMAHISGLVAAGVIPTPFEHCDIVTTSCSKTLRGPHAGVIFYKKGKHIRVDGKQVDYSHLQREIDSSVFPGMQGGPHNSQIASVAACMYEATQPFFRQYCLNVVNNAKALAKAMQQRGYKVISGGTDTHLMLIDLKPNNIDGARVEKVLEACNLTINKNAVPGDTTPYIPGGLRLGTSAMTTRGFGPADFTQAAEYLDQGIHLTKDMHARNPVKKIRDFKVNPTHPGLKELAREVRGHAVRFPMPGFADW
eukprot:gnl/Trimastix_PCT/764.p1 GENE.gnl/Trimastix_PCT/764~~gnl/Trimastix_PCT/764.p1  ORF type:complete len:439 (+),score=114.85 gnl/Trimastix_PCT/764:26-1318(+)